jgi:hypothetical protein
VHLRAVYLPYAEREFPITPAMLSAALADDPVIVLGESATQNDVAFRGVYGNWKPVLRGRRSSDYSEHSGIVSYAAKEIYQSGMFVTDFASNDILKISNHAYVGVHLLWIIGYFANTLKSLEQILTLHPEVADGILRVGLYAGAGTVLVTGSQMWEKSSQFLEGFTALPDFELTRGSELNAIFEQLQVDLCSLAGVHLGTPYSIQKVQ